MCEFNQSYSRLTFPLNARFAFTMLRWYLNESLVYSANETTAYSLFCWKTCYNLKVEFCFSCRVSFSCQAQTDSFSFAASMSDDICCSDTSACVKLFKMTAQRWRNKLGCCQSVAAAACWLMCTVDEPSIKSQRSILCNNWIPGWLLVLIVVISQLTLIYFQTQSIRRQSNVPPLSFKQADERQNYHRTLHPLTLLLYRNRGGVKQVNEYEPSWSVLMYDCCL